MIRDLVQNLGGPVAVAKRISEMTGIPMHSDTISAWSNRNRIPWRWRASINALVSEKGLELSDSHRQAIALEPKGDEAAA